jgi:hypothetical protein
MSFDERIRQRRARKPLAASEREISNLLFSRIGNSGRCGQECYTGKKEPLYETL